MKRKEEREGKVGDAKGLLVVTCTCLWQARALSRREVNVNYGLTLFGNQMVEKRHEPAKEVLQSLSHSRICEFNEDAGEVLRSEI